MEAQATEAAFKASYALFELPMSMVSFPLK
jgi:hypothetical protein